MIKIEFIEPEIEEWKEWCEKCNEERDNCVKCFSENGEVKINVGLYKKLKGKVFINNDFPFYGKCAFCEQKIYGDQHGDIEHFRPKGKITDEKNKPIKIKIGSVKKNHPGYYWLAYDWKNLLPSCTLCNSPSGRGEEGSSIGKWNKFPVKSFRAINPGDEVKEEALLINPTVEDPTSFIEIDETGILYPLKGDEKGAKTIDILGLNGRDLPNSRKKTYEDVKIKMGVLAHYLADDPSNSRTLGLLKEINDIKNGKEEFTFAARKAIKDSLQNLGALFQALAN